MRIIGKVFGGAMLASLSLNVSAELITYGEFSKEENSDVVTGLGMEWLQWSSTRGMSINSALSSFSQNGWRLASITEVTALFNYFVPEYEWIESESVTQQRTTGRSDELSPDSETDVQFQTLFGYTYSARASDYLEGDGLNKTEAIFGSDDNGNNYYGLAGLYDDFTVFNGNRNVGNAYLTKDQHVASFAFPRYGVALVRGDLDLSYLDGDLSFQGGERDIGGNGGNTIDVNGDGTSNENNNQVANVPEPATLGIFALATGLLISRRKIFCFNSFGKDLL
ncbi:PEP-CTERM sorting domain-containing protein [Alteromonas sp. MmMcT2-5]|uniref:PEP-CTERM sorting domain-containing protein n=1 Tax=Alteromonas sp. MmMcT2-5 TaxID=2917733 RepID=UPI001EF329FA|nr:PEP-CTERM sorting domain-containing protein [Alteromonas sp. MmMcT2-5]MCG7649109.1 PEP-CTERM sorting domain-containing protein [Alteromonas sp. MmMcT2-5]